MTLKLVRHIDHEHKTNKRRIKYANSTNPKKNPAARRRRPERQEYEGGGGVHAVYKHKTGRLVPVFDKNTPIERVPLHIRAEMAALFRPTVKQNKANAEAVCCKGCTTPSACFRKRRCPYSKPNALQP